MNSELIYSIAAVITAILLAFCTTPLVRVLAFKINAVDRDGGKRRMHKEPMPRIGGLAMFFAFFVSTAVFCDITPALVAVWLGAFVLVITGILDDIYNLNAWLKLFIQIAVAFIPVLLGVQIHFFSIFGDYLILKALSIPITILWVVLLTNAINLIDGLDGLSCGVSLICSLSLFVIAILNGEYAFALITAILAGSCLGFLPYNQNPAKIIMGDTGALFLGYTLSVLSIDGLFKVHTVVSFLVPLSIFGLPLFDTCFAFTRRILRGQSPFKADRGHLHHRLIDMGFGHKVSVRILYSICAILGISAILMTEETMIPAIVIFLVGIIIFIITYFVVKNPETRKLWGIENQDLEYLKKKDEAEWEEAHRADAHISEENKEDHN